MQTRRVKPLSARASSRTSVPSLAVRCKECIHRVARQSSAGSSSKHLDDDVGDDIAAAGADHEGMAAGRDALDLREHTLGADCESAHVARPERLPAEDALAVVAERVRDDRCGSAGLEVEHFADGESPGRACFEEL